VCSAPVFARRNFRDRDVPTAAGLFAILAVVLAEAGGVLVDALGSGLDAGVGAWRLLTAFTCVGFGLFGLADDLAGTPGDRGFRGHLRALAQGRFTTGFLKILGGGAVAVLAVAAAAAAGAVDGPNVLLDAALVALAANLLNLFDRAPGRALKVGFCAWVPLAVVAGTGDAGAAIAVAVGAFAGLFGDDLRERVMIGDTGAYAFGGALGLTAVTTLAPAARVAVVAVLAALTLASELVSFSRVIERVPPLRWFDELGRRADPPQRDPAPSDPA